VISTRETGLAKRVIKSLELHTAINGVSLAGSRGSGDAGPLSDWDFEVATRDFAAIAEALPLLIAPLALLAQQWDRLSDHACYMLMLRGAVKVDLIFDEPHEPEPPWDVSAETLKGIDDHFWDWTIWLAAKDRAGKREMVESELRKMHEHLLGPLGVDDVPASIEQAVAEYLSALRHAEERLAVQVSRVLQREVLDRLAGHGYAF